MHRSKWMCGAVAVLLATFAAAPASAQFAFLGGGPTFPMSDYGDYANTGFLVVGGVGIPIGDSGLGIVAEGAYGQNSHSDIDGDKTNPASVMAGLNYSMGGPGATSGLYAFGEAGVLFHKYSSDEFDSSTDSGFGFTGGAGYFFPLGGVGGWVEGRYTNASIEDSATSFAGIAVGISIPFGSN